MSIEVRVPTLPESVADAQLVAWQKQPGDKVSRDENLVEIETDKVVLEVPSPADGVLEKIVAADGTTVTAGEVIAVIGEGDGAGTGAASDPAPTQAPKAAPTESDAPTGGALGPAARRLVQEHGLDAGKIPGTGKDGRVTKADVQAYV
ncbi:MAG: biotin/lipoyl-containing protein, partial [Gammaproteobacteria bacterium]